ncbi:Zinc finger protein ZFPM1 [Heterocephalus glaber]|uniref:Zinc finger protein ZFPM1 n=1 Tax=Heterocephalus glaber TaxID=10181 RepID=G5C2U7_HETGA|nr:Zinc finger protein ZFPM1 [Heterocephalus glaber]
MAAEDAADKIGPQRRDKGAAIGSRAGHILRKRAGDAISAPLCLLGPAPSPVLLPRRHRGSSVSRPEELELELRDGQRCVQARLSLAKGLCWGPFRGSIQTRAPSPGQAEPGPALTLLLTDAACWLRTLPQALTEADANSEIYRKDGSLWCRVTRPVPAGEALCALLTAKPRGTPSHPTKEEPAEPENPAPVPPDIQLLPQQAGMASILATAVINKDVFPCKDCGICRQGASSPAAAATEDKPKEPYPNERICPFPQCRKSCPSASSLEIHMRSHSGERPFVCLICLSAFTTKANCERHLKVHTDTLSGVCHSCGFISTTRDILYSHLVTSHMVCQPGSKGEIYSPGAAHPAAKLPADALASLQKHAGLHGPLASADLGLAPIPSPGLDKTLVEATNGEAQNGSGGETPAIPKNVKFVDIWFASTLGLLKTPEGALLCTPRPCDPALAMECARTGAKGTQGACGSEEDIGPAAARPLGPTRPSGDTAVTAPAGQLHKSGTTTSHRMTSDV